MQTTDDTDKGRGSVLSYRCDPRLKTGIRRLRRFHRFLNSNRRNLRNLRISFDFWSQEWRRMNGDRHRVEGGALVRRCAPPSKIRTTFKKCASWKIPEISSKMRSVFQRA